MTSASWITIMIVLALVFDFLNGFNDSATNAASIISSRSMRVRTALALVALAGFAGPFLFGVAVAETIGKDIVRLPFVTTELVVATLAGACIWNIITWFYGVPSSSSHSLIGGLIGASIMHAGVRTLELHGLLMIGAALMVSPIAGLLLGWLAIKLLLRAVRSATPRANYFFKYAQVPTAIILSAGNSANDAQKTMGIITLGLIAAGYQQHFYIPLWVVLVCAGAKTLGAIIGGWRIIRTMGTGFYKIKPIHSFASQLVSSAVTISASLLGGPVSSTQVVSMSIVGAGAGERLSKVRWLALKDILMSWMFTIPVTAALSALVFLLIRLFIH
jgi:PiT family inorganic phosphate transporter